MPPPTINAAKAPKSQGESRSITLSANGKTQTITVKTGESKEVSFASPSASTGAVAGR